MTATTTMPSHPDVSQSDIDRANSELAELGRLEAQIESRQARLNLDVAKLAEEAQSDVRGTLERIATLEASLKEFAFAHREALTKQGRTKSIKFPAGVLSWVNRKASIDIPDANATINELRERKMLRRFAVQVWKPVKDRMQENLALAETLQTVTVNRAEGEDFKIKPNALEIARVPDLRDPKAPDQVAA